MEKLVKRYLIPLILIVILCGVRVSAGESPFHDCRYTINFERDGNVVHVTNLWEPTYVVVPFSQLLTEKGYDVSTIEEIVFDDTVYVDSFKEMFKGMSSLKKVNFDKVEAHAYKNNIDLVDSFESAFEDCKSLESLDLSKFRITPSENVNDYYRIRMKNAFKHCNSLKEVTFADEYCSVEFCKDYRILTDRGMGWSSDSYTYYGVIGFEGPEDAWYDWAVDDNDGRKVYRTPIKFSLFVPSADNLGQLVTKPVIFTIEDGDIEIPLYQTRRNKVVAYTWNKGSWEYGVINWYAGSKRPDLPIEALEKPTDEDYKSFTKFNAKHIIKTCTFYAFTESNYHKINAEYDDVGTEEEESEWYSRRVWRVHEPELRRVVDKTIESPDEREERLEKERQEKEAKEKAEREAQEKAKKERLEKEKQSNSTQTSTEKTTEATTGESKGVISEDPVSKEVPSIKGLKVTKKKRKVTIKWSKAKGISNYEVQIAKNKKFTKSLKKYKVKKSTKTLKLKKGKYFVRVRAKNSNQLYGVWSKVTTVKVK